MKYLITFGCSWTWGAGVAYQAGMSHKDFSAIAWDRDSADQYSFRALLSQQHSYRNINFSISKSSNKKQFRLARQFFSSAAFKQIKDTAEDIVVLWGITSTGRNEIFSCHQNEYLNFLLNNPLPHSKEEQHASEFFLKHSYDHTHEIFELAQDIDHWNNYFDLLGVRNFWFDSFNHHDYTVNSPAADNTNLNAWQAKEYINNTVIDNFAIDHPSARDLMSQLALQAGITDIDSRYHSSAWVLDTDRAKFLAEAGLVNPYSFHPTKIGHEKLAGMMSHLLV